MGDLDSHGELRKDVEELLEELEQYRPKRGEPHVYIKELEEEDR